MANRPALLLALAAAASLAATLSVACAGPGAGTITFGTGESAVSEGDTTTDKDNNDPAAPATPTINATFKNETYDEISSCGTCHNPGTNGAPKFFGTSAEETYPLLKAKGYHLANSLFMTKGVHSGPELTAAQKAAMEKWIASEAGGAVPAGDGGT